MTTYSTEWEFQGGIRSQEPGRRGGGLHRGGDPFSRVEIGQVNSEERAHRQKK